MTRTPRPRWAAALLLLPTLASAQDTVILSDGVPMSAGGTHFIPALIGGVLLAFAFQMLLTQLSVATGVTAVGDLHKLVQGEPDADAKHVRSAKHAHVTKIDRKGHPVEGATVGETVRKVLAGAGVWSLVTSSLALFFASWLAAELSLTVSLVIGATVGLAVWATFYLIVTMWEAAALSSLAGSIARMATDGTRAVFHGVGAVFGRSKERQIVDTARDVAGAVREELTRGLDTATLERKLDAYVRDLKPPEIDPERVKREVIDLLKRVELRSTTESDAPDEAHLTARFVRRGLHLDDAKKVSGGVVAGWVAAKEARALHGRAGTAVHTAARLAGWSDDDVTSFRTRFEDVLRRSGRDELDPDRIREDLDALFTHPREGIERLRARLASVDRGTLTALLAEREDFDESRARDVVDRIVDKLEDLRARVPGFGPGHVDEPPIVAHADVDGTWIETLDQYVDTWTRPEIPEHTFRREIRMMLEDTSGDTEGLLARLQGLKREDIHRLLTTIPQVDDERADRMIGWIEKTRDEVVARVERVTAEAHHRADEARDLAVAQAEEARKTTAAVAWWAVASAAVSAAAAALGGVVAAAI